ncbi:hypothetical protein MPSEU_000235500 [Mayamaea pseudoterrestris]|nr:hypothetical protein MPSEU_000235500 [Mayamaea pseudoterrestris]
MPPFTEVMGLDNESFSSALSVSGSGHLRHKIFPDRMLNFQQFGSIETDTEATRDCYIKEFALALQQLEDQVEHLLETQSVDESIASSSPVNDACVYSLRHKMPHFLQRASLLIDQLKKQKVNELVVAKLRCSFGMAAAVQFLDTIEYGLACPAREIIDERLSMLLDEVARLTDNDPYFKFRVSNWAAPSLKLAFDLPASKPATVDIRNSFPISVTVEPIVTYPAEDLYSIYKELSKPRICSVEIEQCKHTRLGFAEGAGVIGTACVKIRLTPMHGQGSSNDLRSSSWGSRHSLDKIVIKEARV